MKKADLNTIFTAKVNELLAKGYIFHTQTMAGHQGEIAKVDLTNGEEVIRVVMEEKVFNWDKEKDLFLNNSIIITVGRAAEVNFNDTIWNKDLEVLDQKIFYQADSYSDYLITEEEAIENAKKHKARVKKATTSKKTEEVITDKAHLKALLPYIHTLNGCKSVKARHLTEVRKEFLTNGTYRYLIIITKKNTKVEILSQKTLKDIRKSC